MDTNNKVGDLPYVLGSVYFKLDEITPGYNLGNSCAVLGLSPENLMSWLVNFQKLLNTIKKNLLQIIPSAVEIGLFYYVAGVTFIILSISFVY